MLKRLLLRAVVQHKAVIIIIIIIIIITYTHTVDNFCYYQLFGLTRSRLLLVLDTASHRRERPTNTSSEGWLFKIAQVLLTCFLCFYHSLLRLTSWGS